MTSSRLSSAAPASTLHLWTTGLFDFKGGIQTFSLFVWEALQALLPETRQRVFCLHDRAIPSHLHLTPQQQIHCTGRIPAKVRIPAFGAELLAWGLVERPQLILATHLNLTSLAYRLKQIAGIPYWTVAHGFEAWDVQKPSVRQALAHADRILAVSSYTRDRLITEQGLDPDRIHLLPNTFAAERFQVAPKPAHLLERYGLQADQPVILTVNRLAAGEDFRPYDQMLQALPHIREAVPGVRYLIVGKGDDRPRLEADIARRNLQDAVILAGFVPDAELGDHYNLCDLYAMPSKLEGFGIVFLEALASGRPVLASHLDGGRDAVGHGEFGALTNAEDVGEIARTAIAILQQSYPHPLMYQPQALREAVITRFGVSAFQHTLAQHLASSPLSEIVALRSTEG
ncbi:MAG TPA: glycosyltransferase [Stenomitos sp.]